MDLREVPGTLERRHLPEVARAGFFRARPRAAGVLDRARRILDVGAGWKSQRAVVRYGIA